GAAHRRRGVQAGGARDRGGDRARDRRHPQRGRRPDDHGDREGDAQDARRRRSEAPGGGGAGRAGLLGSVTGGEQQLMEELARVYGRSLFEVAAEQDKLDVLREQLGQFADALEDNRELAVFFFSPYFSTIEKQQALSGLLDGADDAFVRFLKLLIENHRMPVIFRVRREYEQLWSEANRVLPVQVTSAIALDEATTESIGRSIGESTSRKVTLSAQVDPDILGGI